MTMTDPVARHADPSAQRELGAPRLRVDAELQAQDPHRRDPQAGGLHLGLGGRGRAASARHSRWTSSTARTASVRSPASSASRSPACRVYAKSTEIPKVLGGLGVAILSTSSVCSPTAEAEAEGRGWGSPRLRVVTCNVAYRSSLHRHPRRRRPSRSTARMSRSRAPRASSRSPWPRRSRSRSRRARWSSVRPDDERVLAFAARTAPARSSPTTSSASPRASRKGLEVVGTGYRVAAEGLARSSSPSASRTPSPSSPPPGHHVHGRGQQQAHRQRHRQAGRRRGRREHPQAAQARAVQGQGRALRRRGRSPQGRKER